MFITKMTEVLLFHFEVERRFGETKAGVRKEVETFLDGGHVDKEWASEECPLLAAAGCYARRRLTHTTAPAAVEACTWKAAYAAEVKALEWMALRDKIVVPDHAVAAGASRVLCIQSRICTVCVSAHGVVATKRKEKHFRK
jgi:hypothetical protein